jgi:small-conductance mechanosensitive channel
MKEILDDFQIWKGIDPDLQSKLLTTIIIILAISLIRWIIVRIIWLRTDNVKTRYQWRRALNWIFLLLFLLLSGPIWIEKFKTIGTFLGLLSAGIAIALKDLITNFAGWIFIIARKPFRIGDRVQIDDHAGDVIDIHVFRFTILELGNWVGSDQTTGRVIHIPNGKIFTSPLANYHAGFNFIWNEIPVLITFESNWLKAKEILTRIVETHAEKISDTVEREIKEASKKFMIYYTILTPIVYTTVKEFGVLLTIRYLCRPRQRRGSEQAIWESILQRFGKAKDIDFAYPTQRFYNNLTEGKEEARKKD